MDRRKFLKRGVVTAAGSVFIPSALISLAGCADDLLDTAPYDEVSSENMWTTENLTELGVTGVYNVLRNGGVVGNGLYQMDMYGLTTQERDGASGMLTGTINSTDGLFTQNWQTLYEGIHRANDAITNIPEKSPISEDKKNRYIAEVKFLRAYFYFSLNRLYKGVPIYLEPIEDEDATKPRDSEEDVWKVILDDLEECLEEEELPEKYDARDSDYGRITKGAAYALRGKVYLYQEKWEEAISDFEEVEKMGYELFSDYQTLFTEDNEQSNEMIFSVQNKEEAGYGNDTHFRCGTRSSKGSCWNTYLVTPHIVDLYQNKDGSEFKWEDVISGYNNLSPSEREVYFLRNDLEEGEIDDANERGAKMSEYISGGNEERLKKTYENRDPRLKANVITPYSSYVGEMAGEDHEVVSRWPFRSENEPTRDLRTDTQTRFYYLHRKFVYEGTSLNGREQVPIDFPIIRYADVLLMWAEALYEKGETSLAVNKVNEVRNRVNMPDIEENVQNDLRQEIRNERRREFVNEGINFFDELRWKTLEEKVYDNQGGLKLCWGENAIDYNWPGDFVYQWAIPQTEIERNSELEQNPGWKA